MHRAASSSTIISYILQSISCVHHSLRVSYRSPNVWSEDELRTAFLVVVDAVAPTVRKVAVVALAAGPNKLSRQKHHRQGRGGETHGTGESRLHDTRLGCMREDSSGKSMAVITDSG